MSTRSTSIVKTIVPQLPTCVARARLFTHLDRLTTVPAVWVSGPTGSGKTTLVSSYLAARGAGAIWCELDASDAEPMALARLLEDAQAASRPPAKPPARAPVAATAARGASARSRIRRLAGQLAAPIVLVLDNAEHLVGSPAAAALVGDLIDHLAPGARLIVVSRTAPPPSLHPQRARGALVRLPPEELRLDDEEVRELARLRGIELGAEALAELTRRGAGWAAGLVLLLEDTRFGSSDRTDNEEFIFQYVATEIFDRFEPLARKLLPELAHLPRLTTAMATELTGDPQAADVLLNLARNDYFVSERRLEGESVFQWHPLLREFLLQRARRDIAPASLERLQAHAARVLARTGDLSAGIDALCRLARWDDAAGLLEANGESLLAAGQGGALAGWLDALPPAAFAQHPRLSLHRAEACSEASAREGRRAFESAYRALRKVRSPSSVAEREALSQAITGALRCILAEGDDAALLDPWIERFTELETADEPSGSAAAAGLRSLALALREPGSERERGWRAALEGRAEPAAEDLLRGLAQQLTGTGEPAGPMPENEPSPLLPAAAVEVLERLAQALGSHSPRPDGPPASGLGRFARAVSTFESARGASRAATPDLELVAEWERAAALAGEAGLPTLEALALAAAAVRQLALGDRAASERSLRAARRIARGFRHPAVSASLAWAEAAWTERPAERNAHLAAALGAGELVRLPPGWRADELSPLIAAALANGTEAVRCQVLIESEQLRPCGARLQLGHWPWALRIRALGGWDLAPGLTPGRIRGRALELLQALVAYGAYQVSAARIGEALWPNVDGDYAQKSLTVTLHRLRRALGDTATVRLEEGRLGLDPDRTWTDVGAIEQVESEMERLRGRDGRESRERHGRDRAAGAHDVSEEVLWALDDALGAFADQLLDSYRGPLLDGQPEHPWVDAARDRVERRFAEAVAWTAQTWTRLGRLDDAASTCERALTRAPANELVYRRLIDCHEMSGHIEHALDLCDRLAGELSARGREPSVQSAAIRARLERKLTAR